MGKHAKFSASGSERYLSCPGSMALCEKAPPQAESKYAAEGTSAHEALEFVMKNATMPIKKVMAMLSNKYSRDMINNAIETTDHIYKLMPEGAKLLCETKVELDFVEPGMFGTVDAAIVDMFGVLWVIDYKYGKGRAIEPDNNSQMIYYALGIAHKYDFNFSKVRLAIAQPRIVHKNGFFRTWDMSIDELKSWIDIFKKGVEQCKDPFAELNAGRHCYFCPAKSICPLTDDQKFVEAQNDFDN